MPVFFVSLAARIFLTIRTERWHLRRRHYRLSRESPSFIHFLADMTTAFGDALAASLRFFYDNGTKPRVDVRGTKALDLTPRRFVRDVVRAVAGREL